MEFPLNATMAPVEGLGGRGGESGVLYHWNAARVGVYGPVRIAARADVAIRLMRVKRPVLALSDQVGFAADPLAEIALTALNGLYRGREQRRPGWDGAG